MRLIACVVGTVALSYAGIGAYIHIMRGARPASPCQLTQHAHRAVCRCGAGIVAIPVVLVAWLLAEPSLSTIDIAMLAACAALTLAFLAR